MQNINKLSVANLRTNSDHGKTEKQRPPVEALMKWPWKMDIVCSLEDVQYTNTTAMAQKILPELCKKKKQLTNDTLVYLG